MSAQTSPTRIPDPSTRYRRTGQRGVNTEMLSWMFMRASGALLVILIFGHLFVNLWLGLGVKGIDFAFVAGKWANPFWQIWDLLMLWLAMLHGTNGLRTIIMDYAEKPGTRRARHPRDLHLRPLPGRRGAQPPARRLPGLTATPSRTSRPKRSSTDHADS